jgi:HK97 family phage portal protein
MAWPFSRKIEVKENPVGASFMMPGGHAWRRGDRTAYVKEGYQLNVVVYRAVREICRAVSDLEIEVVNPAGDVVTGHPALVLLARPNPTQGFDGWIGEAFTNYLLTGEIAVLRYPEAARPVELWNANPLHIKVEPGRGGMPSKYIHDLGNAKREFPVEYPSGRCQMFFMKMYDPLDYWRGQAPLVAAGLAADTHNAGMRWNYALLRNSARPSGVIKLSAEAGGEVIARLKEWFKAAFQGERNAGEIPVLPAGAEWQAMDQTARDMDFMNTQKEAAKLIASAFGVPLPLIDNDASTFNNLEQAKERFYTDTVLPMFREFLSQFGNWLLPLFGEGLRFQVNEDKIGALESVRTRLFDRMIRATGAGVLTVDEAREAMGYDPLGDDLTKDDVKRGMAVLAYGKE